MATAKNTNGRPIFTTWQWLSIIVMVIGGIVGLDQRMKSCANVFKEANLRDHQMIRRELETLQRGIPPNWFREVVRENSEAIATLESELDGLKITMTELTTLLKQIENRNG